MSQNQMVWNLNGLWNVLCILTSKRVLCKPLANQNQFFDTKITFCILLSHKKIMQKITKYHVLKGGLPVLIWYNFNKWNLGIPFHFRDWDGMGSGPVLNARDQEFSAFSGKKIWYPKTRPGMQTSKFNTP